ncbi:hypothetical protein AJ78_04738 [Emergomyces pasteurianus Ep9510]|uniref:DHHA2 domain-containing protein n=1 Tax=Emergomyces pasteurianus Ep9510 TaxID=1447872 RepID=A0A1J9Q436_9EURO|nr:hypothetical protein AJ78_04738 [Emergomyces pasteurianus Ep9510]
MSKPTSLTRGWDLLRFLKQAHASSHFPHSQQFSPTPSSSTLSARPSKSQIYVLGNPSADLDSIISAIIYSYFATRVVSADTESGRGGGENHLREYIPLIDLPDVRAGRELARLRPEFVTALRIAVGWDGGRVRRNEHKRKKEDDEDALETSVLTVADLKERISASGEIAGGATGKETDVIDENLNVMMVDWNALPKLPSNGEKRGIEGLSDMLPRLKISVVGCIDHHDDECFVSRGSDSLPYDPCCIQTGVGSCTSLVVRELRARGLWADNALPSSETAPPAWNQEAPEAQAALYEAQAAKLAMAAILIDTANMTAKSKVSAVDIAAVAFLEAKIQAGIDAYLRCYPQSDASSAKWDRQSFYDVIALAKENSVHNLTALEVLGRDYKEWTETIATQTTPSGTIRNATVKLGICCMVKPLSWLVEKCIREQKGNDTTVTDTCSNKVLLEHLSSFATEKHLDLVTVMTAFRAPAPEGQFHRELMLYALNSECLPGVWRFESAAAAELGLQEGVWTGNFTLISETDDNNGCYMRFWKQSDVSKSRKQVAPLLRGALRGDEKAFG